MNKKQRQTLERIFEKPERSDILWNDIENLFKALGADITEGRGSRVRVALKDLRAVFHRPHPQRVTNRSTVCSVRRFLLEPGVN
jgi:hypothetical protein